MELNLRQDAEIDRFHLEIEASTLPSTIAKYQDAINEETEIVTDCEYALEKAEAVARKDAREYFNSKGIKANIDMVNDEVTLQPNIQVLRKRLAEHKKERDYLKSAVLVLDAKRASLNNLVSLYCKEYYSTAKVENGEYKEADIKRKMSVDTDEMTERQEKDLSVKMRNRRQNNG